MTRINQKAFNAFLQKAEHNGCDESLLRYQATYKMPGETSVLVGIFLKIVSAGKAMSSFLPQQILPFLIMNSLNRSREKYLRFLSLRFFSRSGKKLMSWVIPVENVTATEKPFR